MNDLSNSILPIARLGESYLLIHPSNLSRLGKVLGVISIKIDIQNLEIGPPVDFEKHMKFNPWKIIENIKERNEILVEIQRVISVKDISERLIKPLLGMKEKVFISEKLLSLQSFYSSFTSALKDKELELVHLKNTQDIWCRDFMPVKTRDDSLILFNYDPSYLRGKWEHKLTPRKDIIKMLAELEIDYKLVDDIRLDGGNVIHKGDFVIMTDAIFRENDMKEDLLKQDKLKERLEKLFDSQLIIIPHQPDDTLSHSDGVVRFLDERTILVNNFSAVSNPKFRESKHFLDNFFGAIGKSGLDIIQVPYDPVDEIGDDEMAVALGIYINYLETNDFIFLPQFGKEMEEKDSEALKAFRSIFKTKKEVIPVNSRTIAMKGGVLNCITWN